MSERFCCGFLAGRIAYRVLCRGRFTSTIFTILVVGKRMERTERIALLHGLLTRNRYGLSNDRLMREAECQCGVPKPH